MGPIATFQSFDEQSVTAALGAVQTVLEYAGTIAFALSGALLAGRKQMDLVGVVVLGVMVAIGGGTIRDLLLQQPVSWIESPGFFVVGVGAALLTIPLAKVGAVAKAQQYNLVAVFDAAGMAIFVVVGTNVALAADASPLSAALVGVVSGIGGGVIRDVLANQVPGVLTDGQLYASAALAGALLYVLLLELDTSPLVVFWIPVVVIFALRLLSLRYGWGIPKIRVSSDEVGGP